MEIILGLISLFAISFLSSTLLPGQSAAVLVALIATEKFNIIVLLAVASIGNVLGSCFNWWLGRYVTKYQDRKWFPFKPKQMQKAQNVFNKYGRASLLFSWLPIIGDPLTFAAGVLKVPFPIFLLLVTLGRVIRYIVIAFLTVEYMDMLLP